MRIIFLSGRRVSLVPRDVLALLREPAVVIFIAVAVFLSFYVNPHDDVRVMAPLPRAMFILATAAVTVLMLVLPLLLMGRFLARLPMPLPSAVLIVFSALMTEVFSQWLLRGLLHHPTGGWATWGPTLLANLVMLAIFDLMFSLFVLPTTGWYRDRARSAAVPVTSAQPAATVRIGGQAFALRAILSIEAEEHYVRVKFADRSLMLRDRFSGVIGQLDAAQGLQTHRSYWVNIDHVDQLVTDRKGQTELRLSNGDCIPISRRRRKDCAAALARRDTGT